MFTWIHFAWSSLVSENKAVEPWGWCNLTHKGHHLWLLEFSHLPFQWFLREILQNTGQGWRALLCRQGEMLRALPQVRWSFGSRAKLRCLEVSLKLWSINHPPKNSWCVSENTDYRAPRTTAFFFNFLRLIFFNFFIHIRVLELINNVVIVSGRQQRNSAIHTQVSILLQTPLPCRLSRNTEPSSLCSTVGPCWVSVLNTAVCTSPSQTP